MKNDEEKPKRLTAEVKKELGPETGPLTDDLIAQWFHYKNTPSYSTSPKKPWVENGITSFLEFIKENFALISKEDAKDLAEILSFEELTGELRAEDLAILDRIKAKL